MLERRFTPATARSTLAALRPALEAMRRITERMRAQVPSPIAADQLVPPRYYRLCRSLAEVVGAIHARGVLVRDPVEGVVDFPARRNGRPVLLCFRSGEDEVAFWHEPEAGLDERKPVRDGDRWD